MCLSPNTKIYTVKCIIIVRVASAGLGFSKALHKFMVIEEIHTENLDNTKDISISQTTTMHSIFSLHSFYSILYKKEIVLSISFDGRSCA